MLAKQAAGIDVLSGGRFELGLDRERQSRLFAEQVVPAVRESLTRLAPSP